MGAPQFPPGERTPPTFASLETLQRSSPRVGREEVVVQIFFPPLLHDLLRTSSCSIFSFGHDCIYCKTVNSFVVLDRPLSRRREESRPRRKPALSFMIRQELRPVRPPDHPTGKRARIVHEPARVRPRRPEDPPVQVRRHPPPAPVSLSHQVPVGPRAAASGDPPPGAGVGEHEQEQSRGDWMVSP